MQSANRRVLVAVAPPLLAAVLARLLSAEERDVVIHGAGVGAAAEERFDIAVVTDFLPYGVLADSVVRLPDQLGNAGVGSVVTGGELRKVHIAEVSGLVELLERL